MVTCQCGKSCNIVPRDQQFSLFPQLCWHPFVLIWALILPYCCLTEPSFPINKPNLRPNTKKGFCQIERRSLPPPRLYISYMVNTLVGSMQQSFTIVYPLWSQVGFSGKVTGHHCGIYSITGNAGISDDVGWYDGPRRISRIGKSYHFHRKLKTRPNTGMVAMTIYLLPSWIIILAVIWVPIDVISLAELILSFWAAAALLRRADLL